ncbi:cytochrome P450 [Cyathus striatus]|nr:cytochrome P450 [Cyathus striatus]
MNSLLRSNAIIMMNDAQHYLILIGVGISLYLFFTSRSWKLRHIPTAGFSGWPVFSYISTIQFVLYGDDLLREYHKRYQGRPFKIAHLTGWFVVLNNGSEDVKGAFKWSDSLAHPSPAAHEVFRVELTLGTVTLNEHHTMALINRLTRNVGDILIPELRDEFQYSIENTLLPTNEWKSYRLDDMSLRVVSPIVARIIAGKELCKNQQFLDICSAFPKEVFKTAILANIFFPSFLKPPEANYPIVEKSQLWRLSDNTNRTKSETSLDWIIDMADGDEKEYCLESIARRILQLSLASHHTTSTTFQRVLYNLCQHTECINPLREEAQKAISENGWNKAALDNMKKMESVIQETHRLMPLSNLQPVRMILKDYTLDDGTFLPGGTGVTFRTDSVHLDNAVYPHPDRFDGFRFYNMNLQGQKNNITTPSRNLIMFGFGKHACPGRLIASLELKLLLSYLLLNYDIKVGKRNNKSGFLPKYDIFNGNAHVPKDIGEILIRKRQL